MIDKSINVIYRDGFHRHVPDKVIHIVRNNISDHWEEIFNILDNYNVPYMKYDKYKCIIEIKFEDNITSSILLYYDIMNKKNDIIEDIEKLYI